VRRIDYVILYVADLERSIAFYDRVAGVRPKFVENGYAEFEVPGTRFGLYERARLAELIGREPSPGGTSVEIVFLVDDADAEAERLRSAEIALLSGPTDRPWGHRTVHVADPDGNIVEFAQEIPRRVPRRPE
jgi:lactoylglutathione lyase